MNNTGKQSTEEMSPARYEIELRSVDQHELYIIQRSIACHHRFMLDSDERRYINI